MDDAFSKKRTYKKEGYKKLKSREGVNMTHTRALVSRGCHVANKSRQGDSFESCLLLQRLSQHDPPDKDLGATWVPRGRHLGATWTPLGCHVASKSRQGDLCPSVPSRSQCKAGI